MLTGCTTPVDPVVTSVTVVAPEGDGLPESEAPPPLSEAENLRFFQTALTMVGRELVLAGRNSSGLVNADTGDVMVSGRWDSSYPTAFPLVFPHNTYPGLATARVNNSFQAKFLQARLNGHHLTGWFKGDEQLLLTLNATFRDEVTKPYSMDIDFGVRASFHFRLAFEDGLSGRLAHYSVDHDGVHSFPAIPLVVEEIPRVTQLVTGSAVDPVTVRLSNGKGITLRTFTIPVGELIRTCLNLVP